MKEERFWVDKPLDESGIKKLPVQGVEPQDFAAAVVDLMQAKLNAGTPGTGTDEHTGEFWHGLVPARATKSVIAIPFAIDPNDIPDENTPFESWFAEIESPLPRNVVGTWQGTRVRTSIVDALHFHMFGAFDKNFGKKAFSLRINSGFFMLLCFANRNLKYLENNGVPVRANPTSPFYLKRPELWRYWQNVVATDFEGLQDFVSQDEGVKTARPDTFVSAAMAKALASSPLASLYGDFLSSEAPKVPSVGRRRKMEGQKLNTLQQYLKDNNLKIEDVE